MDLGVSSIGAALIEQDEDSTSIKKLAVRIIPEDPDFHGKFYSGQTASKNAERTLRRGARRNNQRFKKRRDKLCRILKDNGMYDPDLLHIDALTLYGLRARAAEKKIQLSELGRVFLHLNQKRGFLSNRKSQTAEENTTEFKKKIAQLEENRGGKTIGQQLYQELLEAKNSWDSRLRNRTYLRSSYKQEFDRIWTVQSKFHSELTGGPNKKNNKHSLYRTLRDLTIYFQRPLKSQKHLLNNCPFEPYYKVVPKSSPLFEIFRIYQRINDLEWKMPDGTRHRPTNEQKKSLFNALFYGHKLNKSYKLPASKIKTILGFKSRDKIYLNFNELDGSRTYKLLHQSLLDAGIENPEEYLSYDPFAPDEKGGLCELWHITYSIPDPDHVINSLIRRYGFSKEIATYLAENIAYPQDYGSLSSRAIKKLLPHLQEGKTYSEACDLAGYDHSGYKTELDQLKFLEPVEQKSLRNPVVEQVLNQLVHVVNQMIHIYGRPDEIRVELARELRNCAKARNRISRSINLNKKRNQSIRERLKSEHDYKVVNGRDIKRYKLWEETDQMCLYCRKLIKRTDLLNGGADIEHIIPKSRSFDNSLHNYIIAHRGCNAEKGQQTAYDFMYAKGEKAFDQYTEIINRLYNNGKGAISRRKFDNLLCSGEDIPSDFVERMKKDTQYIAKKSIAMLKTICPNTYSTSGQITDLLRDEWQIKRILQELHFPIYHKIGQTESKTIKRSDGSYKDIKIIKDWSKRDDHRHHAVDALICALTDQKIIFKLNNLNKIFQLKRDELPSEELAELKKSLGKNWDLKQFVDDKAIRFPCPIKDLRNELKAHLESIFISFKKSDSKVLTRNINRLKNKKEQLCWTPRGPLHEETVMGKIKIIDDASLKLNKKLKKEEIDLIIDNEIHDLIKTHLSKYDNKIELAFDRKTLKKDPVVHRGEELKEVRAYRYVHSKRKELNQDLKPAMIQKILDQEVKKCVEQRIAAFDGNIKLALGNLKEDPIFHKNGMQIKRVRIKDESRTERVRQGYVKTGSNHHGLVYLNEKGKYGFQIVDFWEAVERGLLNIRQTGKPYPIIDKSDHPEFGHYVFSLQKNDLFVLDLKHNPRPENVDELDFFDPENRPLMSKKIFRVQTISTNNSPNRVFMDLRHHLESSINRNDKALRGITWERIQSNQKFERLTKIRVDHLGHLRQVVLPNGQIINNSIQYSQGISTTQVSDNEQNYQSSTDRISFYASPDEQSDKEFADYRNMTIVERLNTAFRLILSTFDIPPTGQTATTRVYFDK